MSNPTTITTATEATTRYTRYTLINAKQVTEGQAFGDAAQYLLSKTPTGFCISEGTNDVAFGPTKARAVTMLNGRIIFSAVQSEAHWKGPVDAIVKQEDAELAKNAVEFFTGTKATVQNIEGPSKIAHIKAAGYWAGPCA